MRGGSTRDGNTLNSDTQSCNQTRATTPANTVDSDILQETLVAVKYIQDLLSKRKEGRLPVKRVFSSTLYPLACFIE